ncbi:MAG: flagellar protein FlbB [Spirochaetales bacterium]|nr:flagellar protein FlbB [Spirochaetales bacterium]
MIGPGTRIFLLLLLITVLLIFGFVLFDYLGVIDGKNVIYPVLEMVGIRKKSTITNIEDPLLLDKERLKMEREALELAREDLSKSEIDLETRHNEVTQKIQDLTVKENALTEKENSFNEKLKAFENRRVNLEQTSQYLVNMPPADAVAILVKMDDTDIIDVFRVTEELAKKAGEDSIVSYWLSQLPEDTAARLNRKMARTVTN